jgi:2-polyprenyl-6-methoxyphenol hydroxylase-like FAD-dependent oxidoreductase
MHQILYQHAKSLGVKIHLGADVTNYWEDAATGKTGVFVDGQKVEGDLVVGAEGVRSKARDVILVMLLLSLKLSRLDRRILLPGLQG